MIKKLLFGFLLLSCFTANAQLNSFCIEVFNDIDGDGTMDDTEQGIEAIGVTIISAPAGTPYPLPYAITTSTNGRFCFNDLPDGVYTLQVEVPTGWQVSNGGSPFLTVTLPSSDEDGTFQFALQSTLATAQFSRSAFSVYPNPATTVLTVLAHNDDNADINLYTIQGKLVHSQKITSPNSQVNMSHLAQGVYVLQMITGNYTEIRKIVIE